VDQFGAFFALVMACFLFVGVLACLELGRRLGARRLAAVTDSSGGRTGISAVEGSVFGLLGLLIAFTFSGALQRWDVRRSYVVAETNDVGTAWLRIDLLPGESQPPLRDLFRRYLDARLGVYRALPDRDAAKAELARSEGLQREIWAYAVAVATKPDADRARMLLLPALNEMFDITTVRTQALYTHPPPVVYALLFSLLLTSSLIAGFSMASTPVRHWLHMPDRRDRPAAGRSARRDEVSR
jgi:hypothetical protein